MFTVILNKIKDGIFLKGKVGKWSVDRRRFAVLSYGHGGDAVVCFVHPVYVHMHLIIYVETLYGSSVAQNEVYANVHNSIRGGKSARVRYNYCALEGVPFARAILAPPVPSTAYCSRVHVV